MRRRFRPGLVPTLVFFPLLYLLIRLGFWQLDRADEKQHIIDHYEQMAQMAPLTELPSATAERMSIHNRKVSIAGHFIVGHSFLLDNQTHNSRVGYHVISAFRESGSGRVVLVDRGWLPMPQMRRDIMPDTTVTDGLVTIEGIIYAPAKKALSFAQQGSAHAPWPRVIETVWPNDQAKALGLKLEPYWLQLDPGDPLQGAYVREWHLVAAPPQQSFSYAIQWFAMAAVLVFLYIYLNFKPKEKE